jgi:hypothetical protein
MATRSVCTKPLRLKPFNMSSQTPADSVGVINTNDFSGHIWLNSKNNIISFTRYSMPFNFNVRSV